MTNADVIRKMTDEQMAKFLAKVYGDLTAVFASDYNACIECDGVGSKCYECASKWVKKDAFEDKGGMWFNHSYTPLPEIAEMINNLEIGKATPEEQMLLSAFMKCYLKDIYYNREKRNG